ncbi:EVE domain-containing protein [Ureibacillus sp. MALMAid1270]|uniref:EVE domain-containing protein n=1 Tax=Ureibacillus sp. MALMAid1270 TaxID=3411629 RepID=UPI003BA721E7
MAKEKKKLDSTGYWTFICNPQKWAIDDFLKSGKVDDYFAIRESDQYSVKIGDLGVIRVGVDNRTLAQLNGKQKLRPGIYAIVEITGAPTLMATPDGHWYEEEDNEKARLRVPIKYLHNLLEKPIYLDEMQDLGISYDYFLKNGFQSSSIPLTADTFHDIMTILQSSSSAQQVSYADTLKEGSVQSVFVNKYERNPLARERCLEVHGYLCAVCDFDFEETYGEIGKNFIHVHHLVSLSDIGEEYEIDPVEDLVPVCPNCHAMLHRKNPPYTVQEMIEIMVNARRS